MSIVCGQCGYENPDGSTVCEICAEVLGTVAVPQTGRMEAPSRAVAAEGAATYASMQSPAGGSPAPYVGAQGSAVGAMPYAGMQSPAGGSPAPYVGAQGSAAGAVPYAGMQSPAGGSAEPYIGAQASAASGVEYFVLCPESQTKTVLPNGQATSFYCEGCRKQHDIDGFLWVIEQREKAAQAAPGQQASGGFAGSAGVGAAENAVFGGSGDRLWLEEINSHVRIEIDKAGGTLGRYGKYGAEFFQSRGLLMVSGEHCLITNEFGNWVIRHISRTNQTKYNNMILGANEPNLLEDGKILTLANAVSFVVRIG